VVNWPVFRLAVRLRLFSTLSAAAGLVAVVLVVGALFPAVGDSIGQLHLPQGVSDLLGGADYGTISGWYRSEIASFYGPLLIAAVAISAAVSLTAGEEENGILALVLAQPVRRSRLVAGKAAAVAVAVLTIALAGWIGLIGGVAVGGGGISTSHLAALCLHLALFGLTSGAVALALAAGTGRPTLAGQIAAAVAIAGWLINGFAPLLDALAWLRYLSPYYYYAHSDPLRHGANVTDLLVLALLSTLLTAIALLSINQRDLRR
jgi:ABC-2 type transport system permease protein